jgi:hypothetical protein
VDQNLLPGDLLLDNALVQKIIHPKARDDKFYAVLMRRVNRIAIIADELYLYRSTEKYLTVDDCELFGFLFESLTFQMRMVYDYLCFVLRKEAGFKNYKQIKDGSFNNFLKRIKKDKKLLKLIHKELGTKVDNIIRSKKFSDLREVRNSIKNKLTFIEVTLRRKKIYIEGEYCFENKKGKKIISGYADSMVYDYCLHLSKWMFILQELLDNGYSSSLKKHTKKLLN